MEPLGGYFVSLRHKITSSRPWDARSHSYCHPARLRPAGHRMRTHPVSADASTLQVSSPDFGVVVGISPGRAALLYRATPPPGTRPRHRMIIWSPEILVPWTDGSSSVTKRSDASRRKFAGTFQLLAIVLRGDWPAIVQLPIQELAGCGAEVLRIWSTSHNRGVGVLPRTDTLAYEASVVASAYLVRSCAQGRGINLQPGICS